MAVEHAVFTFDDFKVNSRDDRQTDKECRKNMAATRKFDFNRAYQWRRKQKYEMGGLKRRAKRNF